MPDRSSSDGLSAAELAGQSLADALLLLAGTCQSTADILREGRKPPAGWWHLVARRYDAVRQVGERWHGLVHPAAKR